MIELLRHLPPTNYLKREVIVMEQKTIVITGASDGIGASAARQLKAMGHNVVIVGRNPQKTQKIAEELGCPYHLADYTKLSDVVRLADELKAYDKIDVLCNNVGGILGERKVTEDGFEKTFQVNVLGEFVLTNLLMEKLLACKATVIQTSSIASNLFGSKFDITDIQNERNYSATKAYGDAKLCNYLLTLEWHKRYGEKGLNAVAFEPGVVRTNFASEGRWFFKVAYHTPLKYLYTISAEKSAQRLVRLAVGTPGKDFECGQIYSYNKPYKVKYPNPDGKVSNSLWEQCEALTQPFVK